MKSFALLPAILLLTSLSACGLKGDLERPEPLWGDPQSGDPLPADLESNDTDEDEDELDEELSQSDAATRLAGTSYRDPETGDTIWVQNEGGGLKPLPSPTTDIEESGLPPAAE